MIFWSKKALDNLPFQPYYSILHTISFQKMYIIRLAQFIPKKVSHRVVCTHDSVLYFGSCLSENGTKSWKFCGFRGKLNCNAFWAYILRLGKKIRRPILSPKRSLTFLEFGIYMYFTVCIQSADEILAILSKLSKFSAILSS